MDQTDIDHVERLIIAASIEMMDVLDQGAADGVLDNALAFVGHKLFVEVATRTRSVDAAENALRRFADRMASVEFCQRCQRHRMSGRCITCVADADLAWLKQQLGDAVHGEA